MQALGIIGNGTIAKLQIEQLRKSNFCKTVWIWGRDRTKTQQLISELSDDMDIHIAATCAEVAENADVIITTTAAESPLLFADDIKAGTLIIAIGSDTQHKQELASEILQKADLVIADSISQSRSRGEIYQAVKAGAIREEQVVELGKALQDPALQEKNSTQTIVVDLTGVAVQDIMIATSVFSNLKNKKTVEIYQ